MKNSLLVNEIFNSIDGEGKRAGELATFIRLTGCNLRCSYCDTSYAFQDGTEMPLQDIVQQVKYRNVTLTGGEPLIQNVKPLLMALHHHNINIETNGSIDIEPYFGIPNVWFTIDYKTKSSGMIHEMWHNNFSILRPQDVLKFVVGSREDLEQAREICNTYKIHCPIYISPVFGKIEPSEIVAYMKEKNLEEWKIQLQLHKFIWNPTERGR